MNTSAQRFSDSCCKHSLVGPGQACPACLWEAARMAGHKGFKTREEMKASLDPYLAACRAACPPSLLPAMNARIAEGNWYGLQFIRRLRSQRQSPC